MDGMITLISVGLVIIGVLLALVPTVGAIFPDPRPFTSEERARASSAS